MDYDDLYDDNLPLYGVDFSGIGWFGDPLSNLTDDHLRAIMAIIIKEFDERTYKDTPFWVKLNSLIADNAGDDFD